EYRRAERDIRRPRIGEQSPRPDHPRARREHVFPVERAVVHWTRRTRRDEREERRRAREPTSGRARRRCRPSRTTDPTLRLRTVGEEEVRCPGAIRPTSWSSLTC